MEIILKCLVGKHKKAQLTFHFRSQNYNLESREVALCLRLLNNK